MFIIGKLPEKIVIKTSGSYSKDPSSTELVAKFATLGSLVGNYDGVLQTVNTVDHKKGVVSLTPAGEIKLSDDKLSLASPEIFVYYVPEVDQEKILRGDAFTAVWSGNVITSLDFSGETAKRWLEITSDKAQFLADGSDKAALTIRAIKADTSGVDTTLNDTVTISVITGDRRIAKMRIEFKDGVCSKDLKTTVAGQWVFPADDIRDGAFRINGQCRIDALLNI